MLSPASSRFSQNTHGKRSGTKLHNCAHVVRRPASIDGRLRGREGSEKDHRGTEQILAGELPDSVLPFPATSGSLIRESRSRLAGYTRFPERSRLVTFDLSRYSTDGPCRRNQACAICYTRPKIEFSDRDSVLAETLFRFDSEN
jgi:hypothetical protein